MPGLDDMIPGRLMDAQNLQGIQRINALPKLNSSVASYRFVLQQFGLDRVNINKYSTRELDADAGSDYNSNAADRSTSMHTTAGGPPLSVLGTPVFCDLVISASRIVNNQVTGQAVQVGTESIQLFQVLIEVHQTKNIVKTAVAGMDGTVKEYMSLGDYMVTIRGVLTNTFKSDYPKEDVRQLVQLFVRKQALNVTSEYLSLFGITSLVVEDFKMGQEAGRQNMQKFEANCSSDMPLLLKKKK
jgi:D-alanine-D-alanine ligase-like ATP-grasp enzyme